MSSSRAAEAGVSLQRQSPQANDSQAGRPSGKKNTEVIFCGSLCWRSLSMSPFNSFGAFAYCQSLAGKRMGSARIGQRCLQFNELLPQFCLSLQWKRSRLQEFHSISGNFVHFSIVIKSLYLYASRSTIEPCGAFSCHLSCCRCLYS